MKKYSDLEYLKLSKGQRLRYKIARFFASIPVAIRNLFLAIWKGILKIGQGIGREISDLVSTFKNGDAPTRVSYVIMGFGNLCRGQILRGLLFLLFEIVFIGYMVLTGWHWMSMLPSLGLRGPEKTLDPILDVYVTTYHDNSFKILLYGVLTMFFIVAFLYTWRLNIKQNKLAMQILKSRQEAEEREGGSALPGGRSVPQDAAGAAADGHPDLHGAAHRVHDPGGLHQL